MTSIIKKDSYCLYVVGIIPLFIRQFMYKALEPSWISRQTINILSQFYDQKYMTTTTQVRVAMEG